MRACERQTKNILNIGKRYIYLRYRNCHVCNRRYASLAQLVEHDTLNVGVLGSSPRGSTKKTDISIEISVFLMYELYDNLSVTIYMSAKILSITGLA